MPSSLQLLVLLLLMEAWLGVFQVRAGASATVFRRPAFICRASWASLGACF